MSTAPHAMSEVFAGFVEAAKALEEKPALESRIADLEAERTILAQMVNEKAAKAETHENRAVSAEARIKELEAALADATFRERQVRDQLHTVQQAVSSLVSTITPPAPEPTPVPVGEGAEPLAVTEANPVLTTAPDNTVRDDDLSLDDDVLTAAFKQWEAEDKNMTLGATEPLTGTTYSGYVPRYPEQESPPIPLSTSEPIGAPDTGGRAIGSEVPKSEPTTAAPVGQSETPFSAGDGSTTPMSGQSDTPFASSTDAPSNPAAYPFSQGSLVEPSVVASNPSESPATVGDDRMALEDWIKRSYR